MSRSLLEELGGGGLMHVQSLSRCWGNKKGGGGKGIIYSVMVPTPMVSIHFFRNSCYSSYYVRSDQTG